MEQHIICGGDIRCSKEMQVGIPIERKIAAWLQSEQWRNAAYADISGAFLKTKSTWRNIIRFQ